MVGLVASTVGDRAKIAKGICVFQHVWSKKAPKTGQIGGRPPERYRVAIEALYSRKEPHLLGLVSEPLLSWKFVRRHFQNFRSN